VDATTDVGTRLEAMYRDLLPVVFGFARARMGEADAEDVTAEVFRTALQRLQADPYVDLRPSWFLTVARNLIIDRWRRELRWEGRLQLMQRDVDSMRPAGGDNTDRVLDALDRLSPDHRVVLVLRYVDGCSAREIGDAMGRAPRAVDSLLARAKAALVKEFAGAEV
jgi:RNA polymerase sigma-70 factor (ECF subfamily)